jgi:hypothetical protein
MTRDGKAHSFAMMSKRNEHVQCFTSASSHRMWIPSQRRWYSAKEKFNHMLFPVLPECAEAAGVPCMPWVEAHDHHKQVGNSIHVAVVGVAMLSVFLNVELLPKDAEVAKLQDPASGADVGYLRSSWCRLCRHQHWQSGRSCITFACS